MCITTGILQKMKTTLSQPVIYHLPIGEEQIPLNPYIGKTVQLTHTGNIYCCSCGKKTKKSYSQGHCYPCMTKLASCDMCIMKPELCHHADGTCREPEWGENNCMTDHYVYLANTSSLKVGITRHTQIPTRWIDQGAIQALPIFKVKTRYISGLVEVALAKMVKDKTNWRVMLKGEIQETNLIEASNELIPQIEEVLNGIKARFGENSVEQLSEKIVNIQYPVDQYPTKISSHNFDKHSLVEGTLLGIKGQYLILDTGVINIRKFTSYEIMMKI